VPIEASSCTSDPFDDAPRGTVRIICPPTFVTGRIETVLVGIALPQGR
jgi:hypothetical protein